MSATTRDGGLLRELAYLEVGGAPVYTSRYTPAGDVRRVVLLCPSLGREAWAHLNILHRLAAEAARTGCSTAIVHLPGTGESPGTAADLTLERVVEILGACCEDLRTRHPGPALTLGGPRLGAWFAAAAAPTVQPTDLLLLQPVADPATFFEELARMQPSTTSHVDAMDAGIDTAPPDLKGPGLTDLLAATDAAVHVIAYERPAAAVAANPALPGSWRGRTDDAADMVLAGLRSLETS